LNQPVRGRGDPVGQFSIDRNLPADPLESLVSPISIAHLSWAQFAAERLPAASVVPPPAMPFARQHIPPSIYVLDPITARTSRKSDYLQTCTKTDAADPNALCSLLVAWSGNISGALAAAQWW
jgi:hypothetical protein